MNAKICIIVLLVLGSTALVNGQTSRKKNKELSIGLSIEPALSYRQLRFQNGNNTIGELRNTNEVPEFGWISGLTFRKRKASGFSYEYGVSYANIGYRTRSEQLDYPGLPGNFPETSRTFFSYHWVGIPLSGNYMFKLGKINGYATLGIAPYIILGKTTTISADLQEGGKIENRNLETLGYRGLNLNMIAGFGIRHMLSEKISIELGPKFQRSFTSVLLDTNAKEFPYALGFQLKAFYKLK